MFRQAAEELNVDSSASFMIGDSERDILFGKNAGMKTIGVMTGYGLKNTNIIPDYFFSNLKQSVNFIINEPYKKYYDDIYERFLIHKSKHQTQNPKPETRNPKPETPFIISLGGNLRTGKTNFANYLKNKFSDIGLKVLIIELDKWIKSINKRTPEGECLSAISFRQDN